MKRIGIEVGKSSDINKVDPVVKKDDTVIAKPFATALQDLAWVFSRQKRRPVYGLSLVLLVWTNGVLRSPLGLRLWRQVGPSKYELALAWCRDAHHRWRCRPASVFVEAWYPSQARL